MENQEIKIPIKTTAEKTNFLARLRTNKVMPLVLVGGVLFGGEVSVASPKKISQEGSLMKLMKDTTVKRAEIRLAVETFLGLQGDQGEKELFALLKKTEIDLKLEESIVDVLQRQIIKKVNKSEEPSAVMKMYLDVLKDKNAPPATFSRTLQIVGWQCVKEKMSVAGWGTDQEGKLFIIKGKDVPAIFTHLDLASVLPLMTNFLGHTDETVRKSAAHELIGIILFSDKEGKTLAEVRRLAQESPDEAQKKEAQNIITLIDQLNSVADKSAREIPVAPSKDEVKQEIIPPNEYGKWIAILKDKESKLHWEAFNELLTLGGDQAIYALAELATQEVWARDSLAKAISSQNFGEEYKKKAEVAKLALIDGIGALLKTNHDQAVDFLKSYSLYRQGGLGKYTSELMTVYFNEKNQSYKDFIVQFLGQMPKEERSAAIKLAFDQLDINNPARQAETLDLLRDVTREDDEAKTTFLSRAEATAFHILSDINNRNTLDATTKERLLLYLPVGNANIKAIANDLKSDIDPNVRSAAYSVLIRSGKDEVISEMIKDQDPRVKSAGYFQVTKKAYKLKEQNQPYKNEAKPLYDALNETDEQVRADAVSHLTALDLPADEALTDRSPTVRVRGVYNLQARVRKGDQIAFSRLKQIAANEQEDGYVRVTASEFVNDWEEWQKRKQEEQ